MIDVTIHRLRDALRASDRAAISTLATTLHPADWAVLTHHLDDEDLQCLVALLPDTVLGDVLAELAPADALRILPELSQARAVGLLEQLDPDDATNILQEMTPQQSDHILDQMGIAESGVIEPLLSYPPDTAGAVMTPEFVAIHPDIRAGQAIEALRSLAAEVELVNYVYVLDSDETLLGVLSLRNLLLSPESTPVRNAMIAPVTSVRATDDQVDAAKLLRNRNLLAIPVIDDAGHLLGVITHDDATDLLATEIVEDYLKLAGTDAGEMERRTPAQIARLRAPWLVGTMLIELSAGLVIHRFDMVLQRVILLASFMPVVSAVSGNVGLQAAAIVVRGLDTGQVALTEWRRHLSREIQTTALMALACGTLLGAIGMVWSQHMAFGIVIGVALTCSMLTAGVMGSIIPMLSKRLGFDPATTAGPFETAFQDVVGFAVFLWLASLLINVID
jgi:magnesium transporter